MPKQKGLIFAEERPEVSPRFPKLPSGVLKIAVKKKESLSKKKKRELLLRQPR